MKLDAMNVGKMETLLREWGEQLDALVARSQAAGAAVASDYHKRIEDVKSQCKVAKTRLEEIRAAGSFRWQVFESAMEGRWKKLESAFKRVTKEEPAPATTAPVPSSTVAPLVDAQGDAPHTVPPPA